ncbi:uncharacterized protein LOC133286737 [Gastrolobium bilobum]|uniref:uncharacterized protein LOC133286737 n=1 Tax=Gastrolobium bilobum TaxID=150636 RepID=UPI002AB1D844|nr:uncharacterized protein LOC133286737 [Gastrolobium bilobum]
MKLQELAEEFTQYREQNNKRMEQLFATMETRFQDMQNTLRDSVLSSQGTSSDNHSHNLGSPAQRIVHNHTTNNEDPRSVLKFIKPEIPKFDGKDPHIWIFKTELFFKIQQVPEQLKMELVGLRMEGVAADWFQWLFSSGTIQLWEQFVRAIKERFGPSTYKDVRGVLAKLMQSGSLSDYMAEFQKLMNQVTNIKDELLMTFFVAGLHSELQGAVQLRWPTSLHQAMQLAVAYDSHHCELRSSFQNQPKKFVPRSNIKVTSDKVHSNPSPSVSASSSSLPVKKMSSDALAKKRELGLCYVCDEKWSKTHRCKSQMLVMIVDCEESDGESEEEIIWQKEGTKDTSLDAALHSLSGRADAKSLVLLAELGKGKVKILVDSGSSHNFIQRSLVEELQLPMVKTNRMRVFMGNGEFLICDKKCLQVKMVIQGHTIVTDLYVLDLCTLNIVLGMQWLVTLGRVTHNYGELSMEFTWNNKLILLRGIIPQQHQQVVYGEDSQCHALAVQEQQVEQSAIDPALLHIQDKIPTALWPVLLQYQKVFELPKALPPCRDLTHAIPLVDESQAVKVRPYRYPHHQKEEIERQVTELLKSGWIQQSHSAFSSPVLLVRKHDSTWRMCIDYRALNALTIKDAFPIPTIDELLDELHNAKLFSKLDLRSGYHQILMKQDDVHKTAFRTHEGHYEFKLLHDRSHNSFSYNIELLT